LKGNDIPLGARIVHVADALDSMMTTRIYRPGRPLDEAIAELRRERGRQFCPLCVDATLRILEREAAGVRGREPMDRVA
jgi:HD-GYP domain-containing protein (c-di-GMP phosphodiesterase class II)